jgi:hypothetical protein
MDAAVQGDARAPADASTQPADIRAACAALIAHNRWAVDALKMPDYPKYVWFEGESFKCHSDTSGAWALRINVISAERREASVDIVRLHHGGVSALPLDRLKIGEYERYACTVSLYDYDGDGVPEVFVWANTIGASDFNTKRVRLMVTFAGSRVAPFEPARPFDAEALQDLDGDGVPELLYVYFRSPELNCSQTSLKYSARWMPDRSFSPSAPGWDRVLREHCPSASKFVPAGPTDRWHKVNGSPNDGWTWIACRRLWGAAREEVKKELQAACKGATGPEDPCNEPCFSPKSWDTWLTEPPRRLE